MGENRLGLGAVQGPAKEGEVRTSSGGFAPQADVERVSQRIQTRQTEVEQEQQANAAKLKEDRKPVAKQGLGIPDLSGAVQNTPRGREARPANYLFADVLKDMPKGGPSRPVDRSVAERADWRFGNFPVQQDRKEESDARRVRVSAISSWREQSEMAGLTSRVARSQKIDRDVNAKTQELISSGNVSEAAAHHYGMSYLYHRDLKTIAGKRRIEAVKNNPSEYLKWHGFDAGSSGQQSQGTIPNASKPVEMPRQLTKKPAGKSAKASNLEAAITEFGGNAPVAPRTAPSMLSPESQEQYEAKLKENSNTTRAQRNNAAFRGEA
jgi:hypothetical protein